MIMTFDIPTDVHARVSGIPDLDLRVARFLQHEAQLEDIRHQRYSDAARGIAQRAIRAAEKDKAAGFDWDRSFDSLQKKHAEITSTL